ncbi:uncharacterized protein LOC124166546 [Ischnura elegans]|uniref:uncharacterized protein LOC124166546 n=1 Tax=Ischnura elegans TaxID=197161 RepID=UPI001ED86DE9|nr:uncharacterized protein LOC124166546 [Ischnura elegans]
MMFIALKFALFSSVILLLSKSSFSSEEQFWPCDHEVNATLTFNITEFLGEWLIIAKMDDLGHKNELFRCDRVTLREVNSTHLLMSGENQFNQQNVTVVIQNASDAGKWDLPDIDGGALIMDLDPGRYLTMAVCYRPLRFWWLAVLTRMPTTSDSSPSSSPSSPPPSSEQTSTSIERMPAQSVKEELKGLGERLWRLGIDLDEASFLTRIHC